MPYNKDADVPEYYGGQTKTGKYYHAVPADLVNEPYPTAVCGVMTPRVMFTDGYDWRRFISIDQCVNCRIGVKKREIDRDAPLGS